jgi:hypothetical protein
VTAALVAAGGVLGALFFLALSSLRRDQKIVRAVEDNYLQHRKAARS